MLAVFQITRMAITHAATATGIDPDRLSFTIALRTARHTVINANAVGWGRLTGTLTHVRNLAAPKRRCRTSPRCVKRTLSPYAYNKTKGSVGQKTKTTTHVTLLTSARP
jgi:hypothetical protein